MNLEAYAYYNKHINSRQKSSSGGVYTLLAEAVLRDKGIVFAVCYDENFEAVHREIHTLEQLAPSLGSKYIPSRLNDTFTKIKKYLINGRKVLFVGTPCQCGGLVAF